MSRSTIPSFVAGGAAVGTVTVVVVMACLAAGLWPRPHLLVPWAGVVAAGVAGYLAHRELDGLPFRVGAVVVGLLAVSVELVTSMPGIGTVQAVAVVSVAAVVLFGPRFVKPLIRPVPGWLIGSALVAVALVLLRILVGGGELGHDEAAYALKTRAWLSGTPETGWSVHRGIGQSVIAAVVLPFSQSPVALRMLSIVLSLGTVLAVWGLGRSMQSSRVGVMAAGVFATAPSFLRRGAEFLSDVPSTGLLLVVTILLWRWVRTTPARHAFLYWAVVVGAVGFYIRYQSILSLGLLAVATAVVAWDRVRDSAASIGKAAGLGIALLVPHFVHATARTGQPWGIITTTTQAGGREYLGEGLVDYARDLPDLLAGQLGAISILVAAAWLVWTTVRGGDGRRPALFLMIPAVGQIIVLGLVSHGEPRFLFFPVALAAVAAATAADDLRRRMPLAIYRSGVAALAVALIVSVGLHGDRADRNAEARAESTRALEEAAQIIRAEADGPCLIVTGVFPQMTWFSGCPTTAFDMTSATVDSSTETDAFLLLSERGPREPTGGLRQEYLAITEGEPFVIESDGGFGDLEVWRLAG